LRLRFTKTHNPYQELRTTPSKNASWRRCCSGSTGRPPRARRPSPSASAAARGRESHDVHE
jgi:hypothetical protein